MSFLALSPAQLFLQQENAPAANRNAMPPEPSTSSASTPESSRKLVEAAQQFEAIFLRQVLSSLEKTSHLAGDNAMQSSGLYGSMMVDALSDAVARAGGIGLAQLIERDLNDSTTIKQDPSTPSAAEERQIVDKIP